jgi:hypothetical protein
MNTQTAISTRQHWQADAPMPHHAICCTVAGTLVVRAGIVGRLHPGEIACSTGR